MPNFNFNNFEEEEDNAYSDAFNQWDEARKNGILPGYYDPDDLCEIIDTYLSMDDVEECQFVIKHALKIHPHNEDMVYDIMQILDDYELWNDLLELTINYKYLEQVWTSGHRLTALLHLGMEDEAFTCFRQAKKKFAKNKEDLSIIYQAMSESLYDVDLYEAAIDVIDEILPQIDGKGNEDLFWIQLQCYLSMKDKENVEKIADYLLNLNPMDGETWSRLGLIFKEIGEKERSIEAFEFADSLGKREPVDILNLIYSYKENGNFLKALEKSDEYLEHSPEDYIINLLASNICIEMEEWGKALKYIEQALKTDPSSNYLYLYKSKCLLKLGEIKKAINTLEDGLKNTNDETGEIKKQLEALRKDYPEY